MQTLHRFKTFEGLKFSDGVEVDTSGEIRTLELKDGWYVTGGGMLVPVKDEQEAIQMVKDLKGNKEAKK